MIRTLFVRNKHIIIRIINFFNSNFLLCVTFFCGKKVVNIIWFYFPHALFAGPNSDTIYLVVLTLGIRFMLLSSEWDEVSETHYLSWLQSTVSFEFWSFGGPHGVEAAFPQRPIYIPPNPPLPSRFWLER